MIRHGVVLVMSCLVAVGARAAPNTSVSRYSSSEAGFAVNSWLVPTDSGLIVFDTQFTVSEADKLAEAVTATGRPLRAIVITHPHPDHNNGTCRLLKIAHVPVYATQSTIDGIRATAEAKRTEWKPAYGKEYPDETCFPDSVLPAYGQVTVDGLELRVRDYGAGEASTESLILVPRLKAAFVGDLIYMEVHPWLAEGRSQWWLDQLGRLASDMPSTWTVYPGHGPSGGSSVISAQRNYIVGFRAAIQKSATSGGLSKDAMARIVEQYRTHYPHWALEMLIPLNVEAVATELTRGGAP
jgi:glyoxylase-like metal-dependent hydrolase (beta-lactamase superfamily II)